MFRCFKSYRGVLVLLAAATIGLYLVFWHGQHLAAVLPFAIFAACPLMHVFGHGHHDGKHQNQAGDDESKSQSHSRPKA